MRAVLADAIRCLARAVGRPAEREKLARAARRWVMTMDASWPYSFENVCFALNLDPSGVRTRLLGPPATVRAILERLEEHLLTA